jgi:hypothetical protein
MCINNLACNCQVLGHLYWQQSLPCQVNLDSPQICEHVRDITFLLHLWCMLIPQCHVLFVNMTPTVPWLQFVQLFATCMYSCLRRIGMLRMAGR